LLLSPDFIGVDKNTTFASTPLIGFSIFSIFYDISTENGRFSSTPSAGSAGISTTAR
jgi:hypothetical protein